ncbi:MAG TPA: hypothetical protein VEG26_09650 [Steroidobacteraceae bacterium]|nr:hypothetical protein [Steroidobacteraceae bacterium]
MKLPEEDHWLSRAETRTQLLQALESFLKQHLWPRVSGGRALERNIVVELLA